MTIDPVVEIPTPEPEPEPVPEPQPEPELALEPAPEPQSVDEAGQLIPTPEPAIDETPADLDAGQEADPSDVAEEAVAEETVTAGSSGSAYSPPVEGFEHTAFNPENVQHIS